LAELQALRGRRAQEHRIALEEVEALRVATELLEECGLQLGVSKHIDTDELERGAPISESCLHLDLRARHRDTWYARDLRVDHLVKRLRAGRLDGKIGEPIQTACSERDFISGRTVDEIDGQSERYAQCDRDDCERCAPSVVPKRPEDGSFEHRCIHVSRPSRIGSSEPRTNR
jgi:hypothetical protein